MLMSKSRLEKFLYALYSLDSSDLPTPLSRIEELYKCLVTGEEAPTFKPLSRVEKYLMAILGAYNVNELPNPLSRVEVLLYKLATGDDNLDDIKSFLSEHEELLAEIIRNGGAGGNINIEYVLHTLTTEHNTLYNTAKKPVKSAILKGQTLVNLASQHEVSLLSVSKIETGFKFNAMAEDFDHKIVFLNIAKPDTYYTYIFTSDTAFEYQTGWDATNSGSWNQPTHQAVVGLNVLRVKTEVNTTKKSLLFRTTGNRVGNKDVYLTNFMILEGDYTNLDIPYFEGMQSVRMPVLTTTGKNLFDKNTNAEHENGFHRNVDGLFLSNGNMNSYKIEIKPNTDYAFSSLGNKWHSVTYWDENNNFIKGELVTPDFYTTPNKAKFMRFAFNKGTNDIDLFRNSLQIEQGKVVGSYEPFKSNILTVNEEVTLRSNGDVYDELNLLTGRLTQRIDENNEVLSQEVVKTVDLSVVNQDGNDTELSTFNDITHVTLSSEGLIPEAELEVATKNEEVLNTMSLEMDDISATQTTLDETSNTQSENVDATMIATTEIYEQLL